MKVSHLPQGSFREILSRRRQASFPKLKRRELAVFGIDTNSEIIDLRKENSFAEVCEFTDKLCAFIGIPPLNLYLVPDRKYVEAFLTPESNSCLLTGNIKSVENMTTADIKMIWSRIVCAIVAHETRHGIEGDIEPKRMMEGDISEHYRYISEFRADAFAYIMTGANATMQMLEFNTAQRARYLASKGVEIIDHVHQTEETENHPALLLRQFSLMALDPLRGKNKSFVNLVSSSRAGINLYDIQLARSGVDIIPAEERDMVIKFTEGAPYHFLTTDKLKSSFWSKRLSRNNRPACNFLE